MQTAKDATAISPGPPLAKKVGPSRREQKRRP